MDGWVLISMSSFAAMSNISRLPSIPERGRTRFQTAELPPGEEPLPRGENTVIYFWAQLTYCNMLMLRMFCEIYCDPICLISAPCSRFLN